MLKAVFYQSIAIILSSTVAAKSQELISCKPSKLGSQLVVNFTWESQTPTNIFKNKDILFLCHSVNKPCVDVNKAVHIDYYVETRIGEGKKRMTFFIENVTTDAAGIWQLYNTLKKKIEEKKVCILTDFGNDIQCHKKMTISGVEVQCVTAKVYPKVKCCFNISNKEAVPIIKLGKIEYNHEEVLPGNIYANASCKVHIPLNDKVTIFDVAVAMFPNATGNDTDMEFGSRSIILFDMFLSTSCAPKREGEKSNLSITWNTMWPIEVVRDDRVIAITCLPDAPCESKTPDGYIMSLQPVSGGRSTLTLTFHNEYSLGSTLEVLSWTVTFLGSSRNVKVICRIYEPVVSITCDYQPLDKGLNITCNAPWTFTSRKCRFKATNKMERIVPTETISYTNLNYKTFCHTLIPWSMIDRDQPVVQVTVFSNITGDDLDAGYGNTTSIEVVINAPPLELQQCPSKAEKGETISCKCTSSSSDMKVFWNIKSIKVEDKSDTITFVAGGLFDKSKELYCNEKTNAGVVGLPMVYKPEITFPPFVKLGSDIASNETVADMLYLTCRSKKDSGPEANLEAEKEVVSWKTERFAQRSEKNTLVCENAKFYKCVMLTKYDVMKKDFIDCEFNTESRTYLIGIFIIFAITGCVVVIMYIVWTVKPSVFECHSPETMGEDAATVTRTKSNISSGTSGTRSPRSAAS